MGTKKMKVRFSFTLKIFLPFLVLSILFLLLLLGVIHKGKPGLVWISVAGMAGSLAFGFLHNYWLKKPLRKIRSLVGQLTRGHIPVFDARKNADEIGELEKDLEKHVYNLRSIAAFSRAMAEGDFTGQYQKLSQEDELGEALNRLKVSLMDSMKESETRRKEEENRTWSAQGLAKFSSLFREAEDNMEELSFQVIKELIHYTETDAGALFITRDAPEGEGPLLEISGSYAFDREKKLHRSFRFGEGLVGRAATELEPIYITDLPADYLKIRSGLGEETPASILLVPVVLDRQVMGVIELASLGTIPGYQIEFIRLLASALATTLAKVKANLQNTRLFEQTKKQAEKLISQEEVFKEKLAQLEKAQEQARNKEAALEKEIETLRKGLS